MIDSLKLLEPPASPTPALHSTCIQSEAAETTSARLPSIQLPPFSGQYSKSENFRNRFTALIIQNPSLRDFAKMHYLSSSVSGPALACIFDLPITANNFIVALETFTKQYNDKKRLIRNHFDTLFDLPSMQKKSASEL
ncbi:uncharacterized protein [Cardiocondyla obscurior]|uniref:uncharacterized protein n=1 Tax=Cardiocondyla obscurior TaxID=286306 RepID=UPI0039657C2B